MAVWKCVLGAHQDCSPFSSLIFPIYLSFQVLCGWERKHVFKNLCSEPSALHHPHHTHCFSILSGQFWKDWGYSRKYYPIPTTTGKGKKSFSFSLSSSPISTSPSIPKSYTNTKLRSHLLIKSSEIPQSINNWWWKNFGCCDRKEEVNMGDCRKDQLPGTCQMTQKPCLPTSFIHQVIAALGDKLIPILGNAEGHLCQAQWGWHAHTSLSTRPLPEATAHRGGLWIPAWVISELMLPEVQDSSKWFKDKQRGRNKFDIRSLIINETWFCWVSQVSILLTSIYSSHLFK